MLMLPAAPCCCLLLPAACWLPAAGCWLAGWLAGRLLLLLLLLLMLLPANVTVLLHCYTAREQQLLARASQLNRNAVATNANIKWLCARLLARALCFGGFRNIQAITSQS